MTLIGFATYKDRAEIITDTARYTPFCRQFGHGTKVLPLPHLDAALITQGDHAFGISAKLELNELFSSFDDTIDQAPGLLRKSWQSLKDGRPAQTEGSVFLVGYSEEAAGFVALRFLAEHDFEREDVAEPHIMPMPLDYRPSSFELARLEARFPEYADLFAEWSAADGLQAPQSREEWRDLAVAARDTRALNPHFRVIVAGKLMWTRVARGRIRTEVIHEFNDQGAELDLLLAGTLHPRAQVAPCECGSGRRALDCCIAADADIPCPCGRGDRPGRTFRDCCMLTVDQAAAAATMGLVE